MTYSMKIENSQKSIPKILFGAIYLAMRSNFNKSDKGLLITTLKHL